MKERKTNARLRLSRETVRRLDAADLKEAAGGNYVPVLPASLAQPTHCAVTSTMT